jgi:tetratricopeptide (TPR) repeat protein
MPKRYLWLLGLILLLSASRIWTALQLNIVAIQTIQTGRAASDTLPLSYGPDFAGGCRVHWLLAMSIPASQVDELWSAQKAAIECDPNNILFLHTLYPENGSLAQAAVAIQPEFPEGWFWLAELTPDFDEQLALYAHGLELGPTDGLRWREYGDLLAPGDPQAAMQAYLQSCLNGDPGFNGCWRAGKQAENLGEIELAIEHYRLSGWAVARQRAAELQLQLP